MRYEAFTPAITDAGHIGGQMDLPAFYSDTDGMSDDAQIADDMLIDLLDQWQASGRSPAALLNAMAELLQDIAENVAEPVH